MAKAADTPKIDGGDTPTKAERKMVKKVKKGVFLPAQALRTFLFFQNPFLYCLSEKAIKTLVSVIDNSILFEILNQIRVGTPLQNIVLIDDEISFSNKIKKCMWFKVKDPGDSKEFQVGALYRVMKSAPPLTIDNNILMTPEDYDNILGNLIQPHDQLMICESPRDCFEKNAPAFCAPSPEDDSVAICDLDYLKKYQVQEGTPSRYGGIATVRNNKIVEISGVSEGEPDFERKLNVFLSSFAVHLVVVRHANMGHLALYQKYVMKLTANKSKAFKKKWTENQNAELLFKALTPTRTNIVNWNIQVLIGPGNSLVGRACSFTNDALALLNIDKYNEYYGKSPDEAVDEIGSSGSVAWNNACHYAWEAAKTVVNAICRGDIDVEGNVIDLEGNVVTGEDLNELAMLLWTGSFYHGFIGDFQLDNVNKGNLPFLLTGEAHVQSKAYGTLSTTIGASTMTRTMDTQTLGKYFHTQAARDAWKKFESELTTAAEMTGIEGFTYEGAVYNAIDF